jgi:hypothetical protein
MRSPDQGWASKVWASNFIQSFSCLHHDYLLGAFHFHESSSMNTKLIAASSQDKRLPLAAALHFTPTLSHPKKGPTISAITLSYPLPLAHYHRAIFLLDIYQPYLAASIHTSLSMRAHSSVTLFMYVTYH